MTKKHYDTADPGEVDELLPWFVNGTLTARDADRVRAALDRDPEIMRHVRLTREERDATILSNETLLPPSSRMAERLFKAIEAEPARTMARPVIPNRIAAVLGKIFGHSSRIPSFAAGFAAVVIIAQAGVLTTVMTGHERGVLYRSIPNSGPAAAPGSFALIGFAPGASAAQITAFLETFGATVVDGPQDGAYKLRISDTILPRNESDRILEKMMAEATVIQSAKLAR